MGMPWKLQELAIELEKEIDSKLHFGVLVPWANIAMESELPKIFKDKVIWHFSRLVPQSKTTAIDDSFLEGLIEAIPSGVYQMKNLPISLLFFGCTSASFYSVERVEKKFNNKSLITAFEAIIRMLKFYDAKRILLITPYKSHLTLAEVHAFNKNKIQVNHTISLGYIDGINEISSQQLLEGINTNNTTDIDAIVISCTALHTLETITQLEAKYNIPVISSNTAIALTSLIYYIEKQESKCKIYESKS